MKLNRRDLILAAGAGAALPLLPGITATMARGQVPPGLKPMTGGVPPIDAAERIARIGRAQALLRANRMDALFIEAGPSLVYFSGVAWSRSERLTGMVIPAEGEPLLITPAFEEGSVREILAVPATIRTWNEDQDPLTIVGAWLRERKLFSGTIGIEETVRHFLFEALAAAVPQAKLRSGSPVVRGCRSLLPGRARTC